MRRLTMILAALLMSLAAEAQYYVYESNGEALVRKNTGWTDAYKTMSVELSDSIRTAEYSSVVILDRTDSELYSFQSRQASTLENLIAGYKKSSKGLFREAIQGIYAAMFGKNEKSMDAYSKTSGVSYRDKDNDMIVAKALRAATSGTGDIYFRLLDRYTGEQLVEARVGQLAVVEITNNTGQELFFNIADFDSEGNVAPILPCDDQQNMLHLFLPPHSVVRLNEYPVEFYEPRGTDRLVLVAYPKPFNLMNVLQMLQLVKPAASKDVHLQFSSIKIK